MNPLSLIIGAILYALGLWSGVYLVRHPKAAPPDKFAKYRDPATGLLSARKVEQQAKGESKGR